MLVELIRVSCVYTVLSGVLSGHPSEQYSIQPPESGLDWSHRCPGGEAWHRQQADCSGLWAAQDPQGMPWSPMAGSSEHLSSHEFKQ